MRPLQVFAASLVFALAGAIPAFPVIARQGGAPAASAVQPGVATGAISGVVRSATTGRPLADVIVALRAPANGQPLARLVRQLTDAQGRFVFRDLAPADEYRISTVRLGYLDGNYGQTMMLGPTGTIRLVQGQWFDQANVVMWKPGAITGRVVDERNEPLVGVFVRVLAQQMVAGQPRLIGGGVARTDDRGEYRISSLPPGKYLVQIPATQASIPADAPIAGPPDLPTSELLVRQLVFTMATTPSRTDAALDLDPSTRLVVGNFATPPPPVNGRAQAYPSTFHPAAINPAGAATIELGPGEERSGADIALRPVPAFRVSGTIDGPPDATAGLVLRLMPEGLEELTNGGEVATTAVRENGRFTFLGVPAGHYSLEARRYTTDYSLQGPPGALTLPRPPGMTDSGAQSGPISSASPGTNFLTRSGVSADVYWARMPVVVDAGDITNLGVSLQRCLMVSGRFVFEGTSRAILTAPMARAGGSQSPVVVVETTTPPVTMPTVYAEPANGDPTLGRLRSNPTDQDNANETFLIDGLRPGRYVLRVPARAGQFIVKSIKLGAEDLTFKPLDTSTGRNLNDLVITFTDRLTSIGGSVRDGQQVVTNAAVIAFPVERDQWSSYGLTPIRIVATPLSGTSSFQIDALPAGDYYVVAVEPSQIIAWQDPKFLERAAAVATKLTLGWGDTLRVELKLARIK